MTQYSGTKGEQVEYLCIASTGFPDIILYRSKHISAISNPTDLDREEAASQFVPC